jgi:hypothetical protein
MDAPDRRQAVADELRFRREQFDALTLEQQSRVLSLRRALEVEERRLLQLEAIGAYLRDWDADLAALASQEEAQRSRQRPIVPPASPEENTGEHRAD